MSEVYKINYNDTDYDIKDTYAERSSNIAPTEASTTASQAYDEGTFFHYNDTLYVATDDIASAGTITPNTNCEATNIGAEVTKLNAGVQDLKNALSDVANDGLYPLDYSLTSGIGITYKGAERSNNSMSATDYVDVSNYKKIVYMRRMSTSSSSVTDNTFGMAFYNSSKVYINGQYQLNKQPAETYTPTTIDVPPTAKYARFSVLTASAGVFYVKGYTTINSVYDLQDDVNYLENNGYLQLNQDGFELGDWSTYSSTTDRSYRVRYKTSLEYDRDVYILADEGYLVVAIQSDGTGHSANPIIKIPKNNAFRLYVRRFTENTSEVISDITPFVNAVHISTALAPIELYSPTFTDVSMFERIGVGGDSYSAGGGIISGIKPLTWCKNLERQAGISVDIYAKSGESIVDWNADQSNGLPALLAGTECGLYFLWHGINGTSSAESLGTSADMSANPHPQTFYGQYVEAIEQIKTTFPNARIVVATVEGTNFGLYQSNYANANTAIKAIAEYCEIPCIDIAADDFYRSMWYADNSKSSHPTAMLTAGMAMANRRLISKCIQDNPNYFVDYGATE